MVDTPLDIVKLERYDRTTVSLCEICSLSGTDNGEDEVVEGTIREDWDRGRNGRKEGGREARVVEIDKGKL